MEPKEYNQEEQGMSVEDEGFYGGSGEGLSSPQESNELCPTCKQPLSARENNKCKNYNCAQYDQYIPVSERIIVAAKPKQEEITAKDLTNDSSEHLFSSEGAQEENVRDFSFHDEPIVDGFVEKTVPIEDAEENGEVNQIVESIGPAAESSLDTRPPTEMDPLADPENTRSKAIALRQTDGFIGNKDSGFNQNWEDMSPVELGNALQNLSDTEYAHLLWAIESAQGNKNQKVA